MARRTPRRKIRINIVVARSGAAACLVGILSLYLATSLAAQPAPLDPALVDADWHIPVADSTDPSQPDYARLRDALTRYRAIAAGGGWVQIPAGSALAVGQRDERVELARNRLRMTGDFTGDTQADAWLFGIGLDAAVRRFQARHGLPVDGVIGDATRAALNVPVAARMEQLAVALERWRWLPQDLGEAYAWINVPELELRVITRGAPVFTARAIVGHSTRPTPSLQSEIRRIVYNPSWTVPTTIAVEDLLPKAQAYPDYLAQGGFRVYDGWTDEAPEIDPGSIDWSRLSPAYLPYRIVQTPGPRNSLGRIKFVFDNEFDVYLHDTPSKGLFGLRTRMFSSGCVRLDRARAFADFLLANFREAGNETSADWLGDTSTHEVELDRGLPIYVVYFTSWVDPDGAVHFRRDLYGRDAGIAAALRSRGAPASARTAAP